MLKVGVPQILISSAAIFGISLVWYDFNVKVFHTVRDLLSAAFIDKDGEEKKRRRNKKKNRRRRRRRRRRKKNTRRNEKNRRRRNEKKRTYKLILF